MGDGMSDLVQSLRNAAPYSPTEPLLIKAADRIAALEAQLAAANTEVADMQTALDANWVSHQRLVSAELQLAAALRTNCPECGKRVKVAGLKDHIRDVHGGGGNG